jgi:hypothetical protein
MLVFVAIRVEIKEGIYGLVKNGAIVSFCRSSMREPALTAIPGKRKGGLDFLPAFPVSNLAVDALEIGNANACDERP